MIQQKKKLCNNCNTEQFIWKNDKGSRYCKSCWYRSKDNKKPLQRKPINKKSKKMQVADAAYTILRRKFMEEKPMCEASLPNCNKSSTDVHHMKGRGLHHLEVSTWLSVCRQCHAWIEENPKKAIELGYSQTRH
jgi:hypothetical protein|tara:strand:+ start:1643 stop:2044 length:402 start_codon:yes stop_codon:yes gene_type:complete